MSWFSNLLNIGKSKPEVSEPTHDSNTSRYFRIPKIVTGTDGYEQGNKVNRNSQPSSAPSAYTLPGNGLHLVQAPFNIALLSKLEELSYQDEDMAMAIHNICNLGNTEFSISFDEGVSPDQIREMQEKIKIDFPSIYPGGLSALRQHMFRQVALYGAVSREAVVRSNYTGLGTVALVNPKSIVFFYNEKTGRYEPWQSPQFAYRNTKFNGNYIKLNHLTFKYSALDRVNDNPYAIPPYLVAIKAMVRDAMMNEQFDNMITKQGIMGMIVAAVNGPNRNASSEEEYQTILQDYMNKTAAELAKNAKDGILVVDKRNHEIKFQAPSANAEAAEILKKMNTGMKLAGLKTYPLLHGKEGGTTETLGRVLMSVATASMLSAQRLVDDAVSNLLMIHLTLSGYRLKYVMVESKAPVIGDDLRTVQVEAQRIENIGMLYDRGVISQQQQAQELGYDKADSPEPRVGNGAGNPNGELSAIPRDKLPARDQKRNQNPVGSRTTAPEKPRRT